MTFYLTFNDSPSGIYSSQVIDVVAFFNNMLQQQTRLVAFISARSFFKNRKKIRQELKDAIVIPMVPGIARWRMNALALRILTALMRPHTIIGRSVLATQLALSVKQKGTKIIYDGRGAITAEWNEYGVVSNPAMLAEIEGLEREAILASDYRIAVTQKLVEHWQRSFGYTGNQHVVIPCTVNKVYETLTITNANVAAARSTAGFTAADVVFAYSGSVAGWQSFDVLYAFIAPVLQASEHNKILFLSDRNTSIERLSAEFPKQVMCVKVKPGEVPGYLLAADYGLLLREESITNQVASPVKFSEYISCGLKVIISENLGDYSGLIYANPQLGSLSGREETFAAILVDEKNKIRNTAAYRYKKQQFLNEYQQLFT